MKKFRHMVLEDLSSQSVRDGLMDRQTQTITMSLPCDAVGTKNAYMYNIDSGQLNSKQTISYVRLYTKNNSTRILFHYMNNTCNPAGKDKRFFNNLITSSTCSLFEQRTNFFSKDGITCC